MRYIIIIFLFFFLSTSAYALEQESQSCNSLPGPVKPIFTPAYKKDGTLYFRPIFEIDWKRNAPDRITRINTINPSQADLMLLKENKYYESSSALTYIAPLDCTTYIGNYYLISDIGIHPVRLLNLKGRTKFGIHGEKITGPIYLGNVVFSPPSKETDEGGFIMLAGEKFYKQMSKRMLPDPNFSATEEGGKVIYTYRTSSKELRITNHWDAKYDHSLDIIAVYGIRMAASDYIFVRWKGNISRCSFNATLFEAFRSGKDPYLEIVSTVGYGCGWL